MIRTASHHPALAAAETPASSDVPPALTLDRLVSDSTAVVDGVEGDPALRRRLLEAGFTAGSPVRYVMATPFGDPRVYALRGAVIALRRSEARCVRVRF